MVFENGVKNIQAAAYNGARTVIGPTRADYEGKPLHLVVHLASCSFFLRCYIMKFSYLK